MRGIWTGRRAALAMGGCVLLPRRGNAQEGTVPSIEALWRQWLRNEGRREGRNPLPDGGLTLISKGVEPIRADVGSPSWVAARLAAYSTAEISARATLADQLATEVRGNEREFVQIGRGGDEAPPVARARTELSNAEKLRTLTGRALDDAIRQYDPQWDGTGRTEEQRRTQATRLSSSIREFVAARSSVFLAGAMTPIQFEGLDNEGRLSVLVGAVWSTRQQKLAENLWNPDVPVTFGDPALPIAERIEAASEKDPAWAASTNGVRCWADERGERVLVAFGAAPATDLASLDRRVAHTRALGALQRFVGESVATATADEFRFDYRKDTGGREQTFDPSAAEARIAARARDIVIRGAEQVHEWRGLHPIGRARMQVVVLAWSPSRDADARAAGAALSEAEERMRQQGAVAPRPEAPTAGDGGRTGGGVSVPSRTGAATDRGLY
ncbi:hypothetical protein [Paracraurococcus lichenis]|uniref:Uncharacterized protein n=1 Tax=Paracraurococcus lichenis TaxID=3064888 RepID=A0ABT9EAC8_9PROT|nr:hypothetical protein [Paracraurococcus sp. LOR1-02]MDO9713158.1 hypothetical protein [Paracraurococcus sp. LOR1-02]